MSGKDNLSKVKHSKMLCRSGSGLTIRLGFDNCKKVINSEIVLQFCGASFRIANV